MNLVYFGVGGGNGLIFLTKFHPKFNPSLKNRNYWLVSAQFEAL
jgi:hypothetical protein